VIESTNIKSCDVCLNQDVAVDLPHGVSDISDDVGFDVCLTDDEMIFDNYDNDQDGEVLPEYEKLRKKKIARNKERLKLLGLSMKVLLSNMELSKKRKRVSRMLMSLPKQGSTRCSRRVQKASTSEGGVPCVPLLKKRALDKNRVLVNYKGMGVLYKATIVSRREKDGKLEYKIHYDGNKKTTVHWIPVDQVNMLESEVDDQDWIPVDQVNVLESEVDDQDTAPVSTIFPNIKKDDVMKSKGIGEKNNFDSDYGGFFS
jgi:hypothetical protein